jgi:hypothetical protein
MVGGAHPTYVRGNGIPNRVHMPLVPPNGENWKFPIHGDTSPTHVSPDCNGYNQNTVGNQPDLGSYVPKTDVARHHSPDVSAAIAKPSLAKIVFPSERE